MLVLILDVAILVWQHFQISRRVLFDLSSHTAILKHTQQVRVIST